MHAYVCVPRVRACGLCDRLFGGLRMAGTRTGTEFEGVGSICVCGV
jgi:hypothetical protein